MHLFSRWQRKDDLHVEGLCIRIAHVKNVCLLFTVLRGSTTRDYSIRLLKDRTCEIIGMVI